MSFCTSAHTDRVENLTVEKIRSTAGPTETCRGTVCVPHPPESQIHPLAGDVNLSVCVPPPAPLHIFSFFYCLCLLSPLSSVMVRKEYCELSQQNENQAEKLKHDWIEKFSYRVWSGNWAM